MDYNSLDRFIEAQEVSYSDALDEVKNGRKRTHWMWYIFPQIRGLGMSPMAHKFGIEGIGEAKEYLAHPVLSKRLLEICQVLLSLDNKNAYEIFGDIDAIKLRSSMTLFALASDDGSVFQKVLEEYFAGEMDELTLNLVNRG